MNPYLLTLCFLMLMSVLTSSEVVRFTQNSLGSRLYAHYQENSAASEAVKAQAALEDFRAHSSEIKNDVVKPPTTRRASTSARHSASLEFNFSRPPNNSRLNFYFLFHEKPHANYPLSYYEAAARLMRILYGQAAFFKPNAEYRILDALIEQKNEVAAFAYPDEFATLKFRDPDLQAIFYAMLKGADGCPSLLNFITFDKAMTLSTKKVNLMFADPRVIEALLNHPQMTEKLLAWRDLYWEEILDQEAHRLERTKENCKGRNQIRRDLTEIYQKILLDAGLDYNSYKWVFDLTLGKLGNILFIEDPETGYVRREKHVPSKTSSK